MIARILAFVRLDLAAGWRRPLPNFMFMILALLTIGLVAGGVQISSGSTDVGGAKVAINSACNLAFLNMAIGATLLPFFAALACGMPLLTDSDRRIQRLLLATPLGHVEYAWARFLGASAVVGLVLVAWLVVQIATFQLWPLDPTERIRTGFTLGNYLLPLALFTVPLVVLTGGVAMWAGLRTRQPVIVFILPLALFLCGTFVSDFNPEWLPGWVDRLLQWVDPAGSRWFSRTYIDEQRSAAFYNTARVVPDAPFLVSRLVITGLGLAAVWGTGRRLRTELRADRRLESRHVIDAAARVPLAVEPAAVAAGRGLPQATVAPPGLFATTWLTLCRETAALLKSPGIWVFGPLILLQTWFASMLTRGPLDTSLLMTGGTAAAMVFLVVNMFLVLLMLFYTVESLYREQRCGLDGITRAAPVPTAGWLAGKALANAVTALAIVACAAAAILLTLLVQRFRTGIPVPLDLPAVVLILGVLVAPTLVVWTAFVTLLTAIFRNRFAVYGLGLAAFFATLNVRGFEWYSWLTAWDLGGMRLPWSELDRLAVVWPALLANRLIMLLLAAVLIALTLCLWPRRQPDLRGMADRLRPAALWRAIRIPLLVALPLVALGIWTGQKIRAGYEGKPARDAAKAYWRRNSRTWEDAPSPALDRVDADVKLFPQRRGLAVTGTIVLRNPHREPLAEIPLTVGPHFTSRDWTVDGHPADPTKADPPPPSIENRSGLYVVRPPQPLASGETVAVGFTLEGAFPRGWSKLGGGSSEFVLPSGVVLTSFSPSFLPIPGFAEGVGVDDKNSRDAKAYPLDHWKRRVDPFFGPAWSTAVRLAIEGPEGWVLNGCGVEESRESLGGGRQRVVWQTEHPVRFFNIVGGPLRAAAGRRTTVYYDPRTPHNVPTMVRALDAARDRYGSWFAEYPWTNLRVTEFPGLAGYAQGFPGNIAFSETIGYLAQPVENERQEPDAAALDAAFYIVAHEAGHQWWGNMVTPGKGPGGNVISEGLAEFSACMLLHHELGAEQAQVLRRRWEKAYVEGRSPDNERPLNRVDGSRAGDQVVTYQRPGWVFWMLRGLMGEDALLAGLRDFITTWRDGVATRDGLDFPLVEDLLASLRPHAPDATAFDDFVGRWILGTDLPELDVRDAKVEKAGDGYRVTGAITNVGTGRAEVRVRVEGQKPGGEREKPPQADTVVLVSAEAPGRFEIATDFVPERLVVDPEVELLFAGRKRCETRVSKR
jgi:ABC-2 type transport system permease protein